MNTKRKKKQWAPAICRLLGSLILALVIIVCVPLSAPRLFGYEMYTVVSGSMEPEIEVGSLTVVKPSEPSELQKSDIVAYASGDTVITHRVMENHVVEGELVTKGDANADTDPTPIAYDSVIGKVVLVVPLLGTIGELLSTIIGKIYVAGFILAAALFFMLASRLQE